MHWVVGSKPRRSNGDDSKGIWHYLITKAQQSPSVNSGENPLTPIQGMLGLQTREKNIEHLIADKEMAESVTVYTQAKNSLVH